MQSSYTPKAAETSRKRKRRTERRPSLPLPARWGLSCSSPHSSRAVEIGLKLGPDILGDLAAEVESGNVIDLYVITTHDARDAGHLRRGREGRQFQDHVTV